MLPHSLLGQPCNLNKYLSLLTDEDGSTGRLCIDAASLDAAYTKMPEKWAGLAQGAITTTWETVFIVCAWGATEGHVTRGQYKDEQKESLNYVKTSM